MFLAMLEKKRRPFCLMGNTADLQIGGNFRRQSRHGRDLDMDLKSQMRCLLDHVSLNA